MTPSLCHPLRCLLQDSRTAVNLCHLTEFAVSNPTLTCWCPGSPVAGSDGAARLSVGLSTWRQSGSAEPVPPGGRLCAGSGSSQVLRRTQEPTPCVLVGFDLQPLCRDPAMPIEVSKARSLDPRRMGKGEGNEAEHLAVTEEESACRGWGHPLQGQRLDLGDIWSGSVSVVVNYSCGMR